MKPMLKSTAALWMGVFALFTLSSMPDRHSPTFIYNCIFFEKNSFKYTDCAENDSLLYVIKEDLSEHPNIRLIVGGHSDIFEPPDTLLSYNRALSVTNVLISSGVNPKQLLIRGYGNLYPIAVSEDDQGHEIVEGNLNRRVDFKVIQ